MRGAGQATLTPALSPRERESWKWGNLDNICRGTREQLARFGERA